MQYLSQFTDSSNTKLFEQFYTKWKVSQKFY